jgi:hypothetical protein
VSVALLYRIAAVLLALFALGHQAGFRKVDSRWGIDSFIGGLKSTQFVVQGWTRTYWGFYAGFGYFVTVLLAFSAVVAWQLGGVPIATLRTIPLLVWSFALCYLLITILTWRHFFKAPLLFCVPIALALLVAAWLATVGAA